MLSAFQLENNRLTRLEADEIKHLASSVWVDLVEPDDDERSRVQTELGQNLATRPELEDIEASARFFEDEDGLHIHSFFFFEDADDHAGNSTVAFTIREGRLFTLRERELPAFRLYRMRVRNQTLVDGNAYELLLDLFETKIEQLADEIENIYSDLEKLSRVIMEGHQGDEYDEALSTLAELEAAGRGSILIPSPIVTGNHQLHNANVLGDAGAAIVIEQKDASPERIIQEIEKLYQDRSRLTEMGQNAKALEISDTDERIWNVVSALYQKTK